jgi:hypothetical protein
MLRAAPKRPLSTLACGPRAIRLGVQAAVHVGGLVAGQSAARNAYRARALPAVAEETGLPLESLAAIDRLAEEVAAKLPRRVRRLAAGHLRRNGRGSPRASDGRRERASYLPLVASRISRILRQSQSYVPLLVFGHTHYGEEVPLDDDGFNTRYLNSGSWLIQDDHGQPVFSFVEINVASGHQVSGRLYRWDDVEGRVKPFDRA